MKKLALIGFGNQGKAWARNLKDSGWSIEVFARENGESYLQSQKEKFKTSVLNSNNLSEYNQVVLTAPDHSHLTILKDIVSKLKEGTTVILLHGYSFCYDNLSKEFLKLNFALLAPKAIASELRFQYESNGKLGAVYSLEGIKKDAKEENKNFILTLAHDLGITAGPYEVRFKDETIADLFSEQSILCSTVPYSALKAYNMLREKGVSKELAYMECWYELKLIINTMVTLGPEKFFDLISPNALIGSELGKKALMNEHFERGLRQLAGDIEDKTFTKKVDECNLLNLKTNILDFWKNQELSKVHEELKDQLY